MSIERILYCLRDFIDASDNAGIKSVEADISRILSSANAHQHLQLIEGIRSIVEDMEVGILPYGQIDYWTQELNDLESSFPIVDHTWYLELLNAAQNSQDPHVQAAYLDFIKRKK